MFKVDEFCRSCQELALPFNILEPRASLAFLSDVIEKYKPTRTSGHVAIGGDATSISLESHEFSYSVHLDDEPIYIFFEQFGNDKNRVIVLNNGRNLGNVLQNAFGMEYFVSNEKQSFLLAVNWYAIEGIGSVDWLRNLAGRHCASH